MKQQVIYRQYRIQEDQFLTPQECADLLKVSRRTVDRMKDSGRLPFEYVGQTPRIRLSDIHRAFGRGELG